MTEFCFALSITCFSLAFIGDVVLFIQRIRRKLNVSIPESERIVRRGMRLRKVAA